ncbi:MAG: hypothetical protein DCO99_07225 [Synechococcus sp. XM-24]|nr:MAG: hypothetical protein DCO99_07225 [Synechococcus sp. XM-24]
MGDQRCCKYSLDHLHHQPVRLSYWITVDYPLDLEVARFARSRGEGNAVPIRIARTATGRDTVAICG